MRWLNDLKIRTKIFMGFFLVVFLSTAIGVISSLVLVNINQENTASYESAVEPLEALMEVEVAFANVRQTSRGFIIRITADPTQLSKQEERLRGLLDAMSSAVDKYMQLLGDRKVSPEIITISENVKAAYESEFTPMIDNMIKTARTGNISDTVALLDSTNTISTKIYDEIQSIYKLTLEDMALTTAENSVIVDRVGAIASSLTLVLLIACLFLSILVSNSIAKPIKRLIDMTGDLVRGNLNVNKIETSKDEVGTLTENFFTVADTLKSFIGQMQDMSSQHNDGDMDVRIDTSEFDGAYRDMANGVNDMVFSYIDCIKEIINVMSNISDGQFEVDIQRYPGKKATINTAIDNIKASLKGISNEISILATAAKNGELSKRGNVEKYKGDWAGLLKEFNILLENVVAPIQEASSVLHEIMQGNLDAKIVSDYKGDFALIKTSVNEMTDSISSYINELSDVLTSLSNNDFDRIITREYVGHFSAIKESINLIVDKLNSVMGEIGSATKQISSGSKHISESAMTLAQGATEQASSIEELTATIDELNQQTQNNAENAKMASGLSATSKENASVVNSEMKQMLSSMDGIKESSNNIAKIIKVIEDIAFQTNLLALNAAVEAARAGVHGKGFAVVAEEVRNLAGRSQNAAKETNDLISDSITRVNDGMEIAKDTAVSLDTIIKDFEQISDKISEITVASQEQATAISEVSIGLGQISQVVQANTSTSEESASASEELASQSETLKNMVSTFKLRK